MTAILAQKVRRRSFANFAILEISKSSSELETVGQKSGDLWYVYIFHHYDHFNDDNILRKVFYYPDPICTTRGEPEILGAWLHKT